MKRNPNSGVTLLETLIGLLVMTMVAGLIASGIGTSTRYFERNEQASARVNQAFARRDFRIWLEHAVPSAVPGDDRKLFAGTADELGFLTVPPSGMFWEGTATEVNLIGSDARAAATGQGFAQDGMQRSFLALAPPAVSASLRYWGRIEAHDTARWHDSWPASGSLPDLVCITFDGERDVPPPMCIRPAKAWIQSEMSLSSLVPPALPSLP